MEAVREQIDRILASGTLHNSDVLRKLFRFLAEKTFSGEADELKEYSVGLDALGKPSTYDPRQDAGVRIQASRLRQKLDDYYKNEGANDLLIVELPKGRFKLAWHTKGGDVSSPASVVTAPVTAPLPAPTAPAGEPRSLKIWRGLALGLAALSLVLAIVATISLSSRVRAVAPAIPESTPELDALWGPFLSSRYHLVIAFAKPLFVRFQRNGSPDIVYHKIGNNSWEEALRSPEFSMLSRSLGNPPAKPTFNMVERSQLVSAFVAGQFFARRRGDISLAPAGELSWQQFADNDVIQFGPLSVDSALPVRPAFFVDSSGVRNLHPLSGEQSVYVDPPDHQPSDGEGLELVSMLPGPMGRTTVLTFSSNHAWGVLGGIQSLIDPAFVPVLIGKLRDASGKMPRYYQVVLRIERSRRHAHQRILRDSPRPEHDAGRGQRRPYVRVTCGGLAILPQRLHRRHRLPGRAWTGEGVIPHGRAEPDRCSGARRLGHGAAVGTRASGLPGNLRGPLSGPFGD